MHSGIWIKEVGLGDVAKTKSHKVGFDSVRFTDQLPPNGSRGKISRPHTMFLVLLYVKSKNLSHVWHFAAVFFPKAEGCLSSKSV